MELDQIRVMDKFPNDIFATQLVIYQTTQIFNVTISTTPSQNIQYVL